MTTTPASFDAADRLMHDAVAGGVFPGGVLLAAVGERVAFHRAYGAVDGVGGGSVGTDTVFDLASLTKPLATALAVMGLVQEGRVGLEQPVGSVLADFSRGERGRIEFAHLLRHTSGLPDWRPYHRELVRRPPHERRRRLRELLAQEPLEAQPGERTVYSDLGFMVLCWAVETLAGRRLDRWVEERLYRPAGLADLFFLPVGGPPLEGRTVAATERCPWRGRVLRAEVHDDNAHAAGGVEGHAGLFGTAAAVHGLLSLLLRAHEGDAVGTGWSPEVVRTFLDRPGDGRRALGFDVPAASGSAGGNRFSFHSVGHLGFTGTSFWMDLRSRAVVVLLTNRVHPSRDNTAIRAFRPIVHDAVMDALLSR